jgi:general secretion pathway protein K
MNRRGFALIAVLWLITALAVLAGGGLALVRTGLKASSNRVTLARAAWAREACVEIMMARRFAVGRTTKQLEVARTTGRVDLGRTAWCSLAVDDPSGRVNLNHASETTLQRLLGDSLSDAVLDWRDPNDVPRLRGAESDWYRHNRRFPPRNGPLASSDELRLVRGFDSLTIERFAKLVTTRGRGVINVNSASPLALAAVVELPEALVCLIASQRRMGKPVSSLDHLFSLASSSSRAMLMAQYQELTDRLAFAPSELVVTATGGVGESPLQSQITLTVVPSENRLAVIRREVK